MENMMQKMMKRYPLFIGMGFMIVMISLIIGWVNAGNAAAYYAVEKATRDSSLQWAEVRAGIESTIIWLPYFKFLGLGMILAGITMAVGIIATKLRDMGAQVMAVAPAEARQPVPGKPRSAKMMRMFMLLGMMILMGGLIVAIVTAITAASVFSNPITTIDAAATGSALLQDLAHVQSTEVWLEAFKFVGIASLFLGIISGLTAIIFALSYQKQTIPQIIEKLPASAMPVPAAGD